MVVTKVKTAPLKKVIAPAVASPFPKTKRARRSDEEERDLQLEKWAILAAIMGGNASFNDYQHATEDEARVTLENTFAVKATNTLRIRGDAMKKYFDWYSEEERDYPPFYFTEKEIYA